MISQAGPEGPGPVGVVFNGCIYNHRDLRAELQQAGHRFTTDHSDTEVLLHAWRQWGERLAEHLDGMYAIALWDHNRARLVLLRDRAGEKPLYYTSLKDVGTLAFASTLPALLAVKRLAGGRSPCALDAEALGDWIRFGWGESLPYRDIREVPPRQTLVFPAEAGREADDCGVACAHRIELAGERSAQRTIRVDDVERLLERSIAQRVDADVPVGCFLSGGIDSSLIALLAKRQMGRLTTLCVRFPEGLFDESRYAEEVASIIGSDHVTIDIRPSAAEDMVRLLALLGLPYGDSSLLPTHWVSAAARRHVKVALSGDGGDELFFGYRRHKAVLMLQRVRPFLRLLPRRIPVADPHGGSTIAQAARFLASIRAFGYQAMMSWPISDIGALLPGEAERLARRGLELPDPAMRDFQEYLLYDLLRKSDTASMAAPIELRAPMLSNSMIKSAQSAHIRSIMTGGRLKGVLRDLMRVHFPARLADRPKHGFGVPVGDFFRNDFGGMKTLLTDMLAGPAPFGPIHDILDIDMRFLRKMIDDHMEGRRDHAFGLHSMLALSIWARWLSSASDA